MNPYTKMPSDKEKSIDSLRQQVAREIYEREERFKLLDPLLSKKLKGIGQLSKELYQSDITQRFPIFNK